MPALRNAANRQSKRLSNQVAVPYDRDGWQVPTEAIQHSTTVPVAPVGPSNASVLPIHNLDALAVFLDVGSVRYAKTGEISRPRNAFVLFRSYFNKTNKTEPSPDGKDPASSQTKVSCAAGALWNSFSSDEKMPFQEASKREREIYHRDVPNYSYSANAKKGAKPKATSTTTTRPKKASRARKIAAQPYTHRVQAQAPVPVDHATPTLTIGDSSRESSATPLSPAQFTNDSSLIAFPQDDSDEEHHHNNSDQRQLRLPSSEHYVPKKAYQGSSIVKDPFLRPSTTNYDQPGEQFGYKPQVWHSYIPVAAAAAPTTTTTALDIAQSVAPTNPFVPIPFNTNNNIIEPAPLPAPIQVVSTPTPAPAPAYKYTPSPAPTHTTITTAPRTRTSFESPWDPTTEPKTWGVFTYNHLFHQRMGNPNPVTYDYELPFAYRDVDASEFLPPAFPSLYDYGLAAELEGSFADMNMGMDVGLTAQELWEKEKKEHEERWQYINLGLLD
ncbi:hypothetical protein BDN72DRAFT_815985 [Pluteus cervinus]|uniref:Uncharacterized protein n=1 Tax=Pluteus cervinus TaxID=181527 RepID=A0ACD3B470_9AGAR|nr:hypothetical protein BDN72DRAFT_815985 [Pluteus cervinus]